MSLVLDPAAQDLLFREARTANTFTDEPVTDEQVQAIYDLVKYGPTAFNQTPLRITLVRSAEARERLAEAEAKATAMVSKAIGEGDLAAANFLVAEK